MEKESYSYRPSQELVGRMVEKLGGMIRQGECGLSTEELISIMRMVFHEQWYMPKLEKELGVTQRTIERWVKEGKLPPLREDEHHMKYLWHDELWLWRETHRDTL